MNISKKGAFIIPYFGKFKNYFQLFLNSCKKNPDYDWIFITDNTDKYDYPKNVIIKRMTFASLQEMVKKKFDFDIKLNYPYKLCDLKPMYGYIFSSLLKNYRFWGHCDTDMIFGRISDFITDDDLNYYDKIGRLGHFTLYKNTPKINMAFKLPLDGKERYKEVLSYDYNVSFDEEYNQSINNIFYQYDFKVKDLPLIAGIYPKSSNFKIVELNSDWSYSIEKKSKNAFVWDNGILKRFVKGKSMVIEKEYLYIHFQSRNMKVNNTQSSIYKMIPNSFDDLEVQQITFDTFPKYKHMNLHYFKLRTYNLMVKTRRLLTGSRR